MDGKEALVHLKAGAISGLLNCLALQPFDLIKTRLQQSPLHSQSRSGLFHVSRGVISSTGILGLWKGTAPTILRAVPGISSYFTILELSKQSIRKMKGLDSSEKLSYEWNMSAGALSRVIVGFILMPFTVVKSRMESSLYSYDKVTFAFLSIYRKDGLFGFFYGSASTILRDAPYAGLYVSLYEHFKSSLNPTTYCDNDDGDTLSIIANKRVVGNMIAACGAGFLATVLTHPFDVIRTRIQLSPASYGNTWTSTRKIWKEDKWRGFTAGLSPRLLRKTLSSMITWSIYEYLVSLFSTRSVSTR